MLSMTRVEYGFHTRDLHMTILELGKIINIGTRFPDVICLSNPPLLQKPYDKQKSKYFTVLV
jgi:hypothetical protein